NGLHTVFARATGADVVDTHSLAPLLSPRSLRLIGIAVVQGRVNASGLAQLSAHPAVYIPDITAYRLIPEVAARYGVKPDRVQVTVPTPFWYLSSSRSS